MSDHDEPTEPFAPVTAEIVPAGDPAASGEPPPPKSSVFAAVNARRVAIALVVIALTWLGVWAYTSDSATTGTSAGATATTATAAPRVSTPAGQGQGHHGKSATTTLAPPPNLPRTPQAYATALIGDWLRHDRSDALRVATLKAVNHLFARRPVANEQLTAQGCKAAGVSTTCTWSSVKRLVVLQVVNPTGSTPVRVVAATVTRL